MTINELYSQGVEILKKHGIYEAELDAKYLLLHCMDLTLSQYYLRMNETVNNKCTQEYLDLIIKRSTHYPLQYILGVQEFMGLEFKVNESVLIPRQDTEILVERIIDYINDKYTLEKLQILDLCTGSGCIAISIGKFLENKYKGCITIHASDISQEAIDIAVNNAELNNIEVKFIQSNLFTEITDVYNIIASNPPYIKTEEINNLMDEVKTYEPYQALDGYEDGLYFYRKIISEAKKYLTQDGLLCFEIGYDQAKDVASLLSEAGFNNIKIIKDLAGLDRVILANC